VNHENKLVLGKKPPGGGGCVGLVAAGKVINIPWFFYFTQMFIKTSATFHFAAAFCWFYNRAKVGRSFENRRRRHQVALSESIGFFPIEVPH